MENNFFKVKGTAAAKVEAVYAEFSNNFTEVSVPAVTKFNTDKKINEVVSGSYSSPVQYVRSEENEFTVTANDTASAGEAFWRLKAALSQSGRLDSLERVGNSSFNLIIK